MQGATFSVSRPAAAGKRSIVSSREERLAHNEAVFRAANDAIAANPSERDRPRTFICECGDAGCMVSIHMTYGEYKTLRSSPRHFALVDGHELEGDDVVARREGYTLVEKVGDAARVVEAARR